MLILTVGCTGKSVATDDSRGALVKKPPSAQPSGNSRDSTHQFALSGTLAMLVPEYRVNVTSSLAVREKLSVRKVKDFPVRLPAAKCGAAFIEFIDTRGQRAFSVLFDRPLFEGNRDATLSLGKPTLQLSIFGSRELNVSHWAWISKGIVYSDMPHWDKKINRVSCAERPVLEVAREKAPRQPVLTRKMTGGCMGFGWLAHLALPEDVKNGDAVILTVTHDTGDLWGKLSVTTRHTVQEQAGQQDHAR